jgi:exonuclease VII small subunit
MANPWDNDPVVSAKASPIDTALQAEGVNGPKADFVRSLYQQESNGGKNTTTSNSGAVGGMQVIPATFQRVADKGWNIADPVQNARAGVRYASLVYDKAGGDPALAGAGYYGGEGAIDKARNGVAVSDPRNPKAPNTIQYGQQVAARMPASTGNPWDNDPVVSLGKPTAMQDFSFNPSRDMTPVERGLAGAGKAVSDLAQGAGQYLGLTDRKDVQETRNRDSKLMDTTAGKVGNFAGNVAAAVPAFFVPGAATLPGAAAVGAIQGLLSPSTSTSETITNGGVGAIAGAGGVVAGRVLNGLVQSGKALAEPFYQGGREKIVGRMIQRFADDPNSVLRAQAGPSPTGALPTLAESTGDAGMARLQDAARSMDPQIAGRIDARLSQNNAARVGTLQDMAGVDGGRDFAAQMRSGTAKDQYERAFSMPIEPENLSPAMRGEVTKLLQMPAIQDGMKAAQLNAKNFGMKMDNMDASVAGLHQTKLAMDDAISALKDGTAAQANKAAGIQAARDRLISFMEKVSPDYKDARIGYADMSKPINQMDVAGELLRRGASSTSDLGRNVRLMPGSLTKIVQGDGESLVKQATGRNLGGLSGVMSPDQNALIRLLVDEVDRTGAVARAGNGPGSATAQRMASQNILRQLVGPTGLPQSWAESALANTVVGKPLNLLYGGVAEPHIQRALANAVLDPAVARQALQAAQRQGIQIPQNALTRLLGNTVRATPATAALDLNRARQGR